MRLGASSLVLPLFPAFPPQAATPPPMEFVNSKRQPQLPSSAWARCLGTKRSWLGSHPAWAWRHLVKRTPTHPHTLSATKHLRAPPPFPPGSPGQPLPSANVTAFN